MKPWPSTLALALFLVLLGDTLSGLTSSAANPSTPRRVRAWAEQSTAPDIPRIPIEKYKLANGLEVILSEDHRVPIVTVNMCYHVGPANEERGRTGFAHLFEHAMLLGSKHVGANEHIRYLEAAGATNINASTGFDRTKYYETVPSNQLALALWLESDRMGYLLDRLDRYHFANEQAVVRNERSQTVENRPYAISEEKIYQLLFPQTHPYFAHVIGSHADIQSAKLEDAKDFFKRYYVPNNASLAIVGDFEKANVKQLVKKYFGALKRGPDVPKTDVSTPPIASERRAVLHERVKSPRVYMAWITPAIFHRGDADADLASYLLCGGPYGGTTSSRLYKKLIYERQIAELVWGTYTPMAMGSVFQLDVTVRPGHAPEEIEKAIDEEIDRFRQDGPDQKEMERAHNSVEARLIVMVQDTAGRADQVNSYNHYLGLPNYLAEDLLRYRSTTADSVREFARQQLRSEARVVVYAVPGESDLGPEVPTPEKRDPAASTGAESTNEEQFWRAKPPRPGPPRAWNLPVPKSFQLANGFKVIYEEQPGLPLVSAQLVVRSGGDADPLDKPGLAAFTGALLDQGTQSRNATQIADEASRLGTILHTGSGMDASSLFVSFVLKKNFAEVLSLFADMALHPSFPAEEVERQRAKRLGMISLVRAFPRSVAAQGFWAALYGEKDRYGFPDYGTEAAIKKITRDDLLAFWKQAFRPNNAALVVTGAITEADLRAMAEKEFGAWQPGPPIKRSVGAPETTTARVIIVDKPGAPQTSLLVGGIGVARSTPDYAALEVMNAELGGLYSSRINLNLREKHGYTYGAHSAFHYFRLPGPFLVTAEVRTDVTAPAVAEIFNELRRMRDTQMPVEELLMAKDSAARSLPGAFGTNSAARERFAELYIYDQGLDYYAKLPDRLKAVSAEQAQRAAQKYLLPEKMIVVAAGDRARIEPELAKLNLGTIEIRDESGKIQNKPPEH